MLTVILVKNVIQINNKLSKLTGDKTSNDVNFDTDLSELKKFAPAPKAPVAPAAPATPAAPAVPTQQDRLLRKVRNPLRSHQRRLP